MALMSDIVTDVLDELRFGSGQDVQIHLQNGIRKNISRLYRTLMKQYVWRDYYISTPLVIDATTGKPTASLTDILTKFSNIIAIYLEDESVPLPVAPVVSNPAQLKRPAVVPSGDEKVFVIWPKQERNIILISRVFTEDDIAMNDDVPFYRDILALGVAWMLAVKSDVNKELTQTLRGQYMDLVNTHRVNELQDTYQLNPTRGSFPTEWWVNE